MNAIPLRTSLSAALLLLMTGTGGAVDLQPIECFPSPISSSLESCAVLPYNLQVTVKEFKMKDATLDEAVACIRAAAKAAGESSSRINVVVLGKASDPVTRISLDLKQIPLKLAMEEVARTFGMQVRPEFHAVVLAPPSYPLPIHTRTYRVPPDFISRGSSAK